MVPKPSSYESIRHFLQNGCLRFLFRYLRSIYGPNFKRLCLHRDVLGAITLSHDNNKNFNANDSSLLSPILVMTVPPEAQPHITIAVFLLSHKIRCLIYRNSSGLEFYVCVYSNSRNDVPRVTQRYGTIAAHTRRRASVFVVFVVFCVHMYSFAGLIRRRSVTLQSPTATLIPLFSSSELTGCGYPGLLDLKNRSDM